MILQSASDDMSSWFLIITILIQTTNQLKKHFLELPERNPQSANDGDRVQFPGFELLQELSLKLLIFYFSLIPSNKVQQK